jgi:hypothetical protein
MTEHRAETSRQQLSSQTLSLTAACIIVVLLTEDLKKNISSYNFRQLECYDQLSDIKMIVTLDN